ncbi:MAG: HAMP domain-containing histidine kinase [Clostridium sp.]
MGIKYKFPLVIILIFVLNVTLLLGFYKLYLYPSMTVSIKNTLQNRFEANIEKYVSSPYEAKALTDTIKENVYSSNFRNLLSANIIEKILIFEICLLFILLLGASIFVYCYYVKPIEDLIQNMDDYGRGIEPIIGRKRNYEAMRKDEIGKLQNKFVTLTRSVEIEKQNQNRIIASISHDFKTPLTSIMGYVERLIKRDFPKNIEHKYLQTIYAKSQNINELINEFDEYISYNFEASISPKKYSVSYICDFIKSEYADELLNIGVEFSVINYCINEELLLDLLKINRVIGNLINNSVKHMMESPAILLTVEAKENGVLFTFVDNGCGVNESELPFIFDPLYTSDESRKVAGLGLSICRNIITSHKGTILAKNNDNGGLEICILMPNKL